MHKYAIVNPNDYMRQTVQFPGSTFGEDFANTDAKKKRMLPDSSLRWTHLKCAFSLQYLCWPVKQRLCSLDPVS